MKPGHEARQWARTVVDVGTAKLVLMVVLDHLDEDDVYHQAWLTMETIAREANCDERTAQRRIKVLEKAGVLHVLRREGQSSLYTLLVNPRQNAAGAPGETPGEGRQNAGGPPAERHPEVGIKDLTPPTPPSKVDPVARPSAEPVRLLRLLPETAETLELDVPPAAGRTRRPCRPRPTPGEFEEWYAVYPRKKKPDAARRAYISARQRADRDTLLAGAQLLADQWPDLPAEQRQWVPHPASWLNGGGWADEPDTPVAKVGRRTSIPGLTEVWT